MKTFTVSARAVVLVMALFASALASHVQAKEWKQVTIALEGGYVPWNLTKPDGTMDGFEPELIKYLCAHMKVSCKLIAQNFDGMIAGLNVGKFDAIMDALAISEERKKQIAFSVPYANTPAGFAALKTGPLGNLADTGKQLSLNNDAADKNHPAIAALRNALKGKTIGIQSGVVYSTFIYNNFKDIATIREYKTAAEHDLDLSSGRIDVAFDDVTYFFSAFAEPSNKNLALTGPQIGGQIWGGGEAVGLRKSDPELKAKFDAAIKAALADGTIKKLSEKWFKMNVAP